MKVLFIAPIDNFGLKDTGYGSAAAGIAYVLKKMEKENDTIKKITFINIAKFNEETVPKERYDIAILVTNPHGLIGRNSIIPKLKAYIDKADKKYLSVVWETVPLPPQWKEIWDNNMFDGFLTPSYFVGAQVMKVTNKPVYYYPHYIHDEEIPQVDIDKKVESETEFTLLYMGQHTKRKGMEDAVIAFIRTLGYQRDASLVLKYHVMTPREMDPVSLIRHAVLCNTTHDRPKARIYSVTAMLTRDQLCRLFSNSSALIFPSYGEGFGLPCHPAGELVLTSKGNKLIEDVTDNDQVLSHTGVYRRVNGTTHREYNGNMIKLRSRGGTEIRMTPDHPMYIAQYNGKFTDCKVGNLTKEWINASKITKGDFLTVPKQSVKCSVSHILISDYVSDMESDGTYIWSQMSFKTSSKMSYKTIASKFGCAFQTVGKAIHKSRKSKLMNNINSYCKDKNYTTPAHIKIKDRIDLTYNVMRFFGLYIAEGSSSPGHIEFSLHRKEVEYEELIRKVASTIFPDITVGSIVKGNKRRVTLSSVILSRLMRFLFGENAHEKHIPLFLMNTIHNTAILRGYYEGDGHVYGKAFTATTASHRLASDVVTLLNKNGIYAYFSSYTRKKGTVEYIIRSYYQYYDKISSIMKKNIGKIESKSGRTAKYILEDTSHFLVPIMSISEGHVKCKVYNMHVDIDESYCISRFSSHNCAESMCAGIPVIYTNWSSLPEVCGSAKGNIGVSYVLDEAHSMLHHGYMTDSVYAVPSMSDLMSAIRICYNAWKKDKRLYYSQSSGNRDIIKKRFGYDTVSSCIKNIFSGSGTFLPQDITADWLPAEASSPRTVEESKDEQE